MQDERPRQTTRPRVTYGDRRDTYEEEDYDYRDTGERPNFPRRERDTEPRPERIKRTVTDDIPPMPPRQRMEDEERLPRRDRERQRPYTPERPAKRGEPERPGSRAPSADSRRRYPNQQPKTTASKLFDEEMDTESPISIRIIALGVAAVVVLGLFVMLIIRINSLNSQLAQAVIDADTLTQVQADYENAKLDIDRRDDEITRLEGRVDELQNTIDALNASNNPYDDTAAPPSETTAPPTQPTTPPAENQPTSNPPPAAGTRSHTVVSGDNLGKIAQTYYGESSAANIQKIMDANNKTNDRINVGDVLIIPE